MKHVPKLTWFMTAIAIFLAGNLVFTACKKDDDLNFNATNSKDDKLPFLYEYYFDDRQVPDVKHEEDKDNWVLYTVLETDPKLPYHVLQVRKYSTREKYELQGDKVGVNIRGQLKVADRLRFAADSAGLTRLVGSEENVPKWYADYSEKLVSSISSKSSSAHGRFLGTELKADNSSNQDCSSWGATNFMPGVFCATPAMTFWNNKTSGVRNVDVFGAFQMWDKWFYRDHLGTIEGLQFSMMLVPLCGTDADRSVSSAIRYGL
jgi:hypothetical protein